MNRSAQLQLLRRFLPDVESDFSLSPVQSGFSSASVFQVKSGQHAFALRSCPTEGLPTARLLELHRYLGFLKEHSLPVAVPISDVKSRSTLVTWENYRWQLEPWLSGRSRDGQTITDAECTHMMQTLAKMHLASAKYQPTPSGVKWFRSGISRIPSIQERLKLIENWSPDRLTWFERQLSQTPDELNQVSLSILQEFHRCCARVREELMNVVDVVTEAFPCWRDIWRDHVLFEANQVTGLIDPTATRTDHFGTDITRLLGSLFEDNQPDWDFALSAYAAIRPLDAQEYEVINVLNRSSVLLSGLTWIERRQQNQIPQEQLADVLERMLVIERRMRNL